MVNVVPVEPNERDPNGDQHCPSGRGCKYLRVCDWKDDEIKLNSCKKSENSQIFDAICFHGRTAIIKKKSNWSPVDCKHSNEWIKDGDCSKECGTGLQAYTRKIETPAAFGGKQCVESDLHKTEECNRHYCPVDCIVSDEWGEWGKCSKPCDGGEQSRYREIIRHPREGGKACEGALKETRPCNTHDCPVDVDCVVSNWTKNGVCSKECGGGEQRFTRTIETAAAHGGKACPSLENLEKTEPCNTHDCPVDCVVSDWTTNGVCSKECGGGEQRFTRTIETAAAHGGKACPSLENLEKTEPCNTQPCPVENEYATVGRDYNKPCLDKPSTRKSSNNWFDWTKCEQHKTTIQNSLCGIHNVIETPEECLKAGKALAESEIISKLTELDAPGRCEAKLNGSPITDAMHEACWNKTTKDACEKNWEGWKLWPVWQRQRMPQWDWWCNTTSSQYKSWYCQEVKSDACEWQEGPREMRKIHSPWYPGGCFYQPVNPRAADQRKILWTREIDTKDPNKDHPVQVVFNENLTSMANIATYDRICKV